VTTGGSSAPDRRSRPWAYPALWIAALVVIAAVAVVAATVGRAGTTDRGGPDVSVECVTPAEGCPVVLAAPVAPPPGHAASRAPADLRALQMNLCDSGIARDCYTAGRAVTEAAAKIATVAPDIVTLNEICRHDVLGPLLSAMEAAYPSDPVVAVFMPAWHRADRRPYRCTDGDAFGDGVIARVPAAAYRGAVVTGGTYPESMQDQTDNEERGWACLYLRGNFYACASHLVAYRPDLAARQCSELMRSNVPGFVGTHGVAPVVLGSDLNLVDNGGKAYDVRFCVPYGYYVRSDPGEPSVEPQHFVVSDTLAFRSIVDLDMDRTTDHPGLLITVRAGRAPS